MMKYMNAKTVASNTIHTINFTISEDTGGFCWCGSEHIKVLVLKTIYQELWVEQSLKM